MKCATNSDTLVSLHPVSFLSLEVIASCSYNFAQISRCIHAASQYATSSYSSGLHLSLIYDLDEGDTCSVSSHSSTSTIDDIPGTGRVIDKYLYQKGGRKFERMIFWARIRFPYLHPFQISHYIDACGWYSPEGGQMVSLHQATSSLVRMYTGGSTLVYGLKSIVRQTQ